MKVFEYKTFPLFQYDNDFMFKELSNEGWEIISIVQFFSYQTDKNPSRITAYCKRRKRMKLFTFFLTTK